MSTSASSLQHFYADKSVFLTGGSGFLGKVIIYKLLKECPNIKQIYVLIRPKTGQNSQQRIQSLLSSIVFDQIRSQCPEQLSKVKAIAGDITGKGLGISYRDMHELIEQVDVVFHSAATIRFDEPISRAVEINVGGTSEVVTFCKKLKKLISLVHVSTAYCTVERKGIEELVYNEDVPSSKLLDAVKWMNSRLVEEFSKFYYQGRPSSYHFTKAMAERYLIENTSSGCKYNVAIVRPSIVTPSVRDPYPGWTDNYYGPTGYFVVTGKGVLRSMLMHKEKICDIIPVDIVANTVICAAQFINSNPCQLNANRDTEHFTDIAGIEYLKNAKLIVFNCVSCSQNPITWGQINDISLPLIIKYPSMELFLYPGTWIQSNKHLHSLMTMLAHKLPAKLVDFFFIITGNRPFMEQVIEKIHRATVALEHFTINEWIWKTSNYEKLVASLDETDREAFFIDIGKVNWNEYMENYILGMRKYLLKESPSTLPAARSKLNRIYYLMQFAKFMLIGGSMYGYMRYYSYIRQRQSKLSLKEM